MDKCPIPVRGRQLTISRGICAQGFVVGLQPCHVDAVVAGVLVFEGFFLSWEKGHQVSAGLLPLGNHHLFQLVGGVHEHGSNTVAHRHGVAQVETNRVASAVAEEAKLARVADNDVGGRTNKDIARAAHVWGLGTGGDGLGDGCRPCLVGLVVALHSIGKACSGVGQGGRLRGNGSNAHSHLGLEVYAP